jgi:hypothetical protein
MEKKNFITGLVLYVVFITSLIISIRPSTLMSYMGFEDVLHIDFTVLALIVFLLPLVFLIIKREIQWMVLGAGVSLGYTAIDLFIIKEKLPGCRDFCGIENIVFGMALIGFIVVSIIASGVLRFISRRGTSQV